MELEPLQPALLPIFGRQVRGHKHTLKVSLALETWVSKRSYRLSRVGFEASLIGLTLRDVDVMNLEFFFFYSWVMNYVRMC